MATEHNRDQSGHHHRDSHTRLRVFRGVEEIPAAFGDSAVAIGNFDGVHQGHQQVFQNLRRIADEQGLKAVVICFEPHPQEVFAAQNPPSRLTRFGEKVREFFKYGIDYVLCLRFNAALIEMSAQDFIDEILVKNLQSRYIAVGQDFRFGHKRSGDVRLLVQQGQQAGFVVEQIATLSVDGERVSSSRVREMLSQGQFQLAERLLGRRFTISGRVAYGDQLGRELGFPTLNIILQRRVPPLSGVFVVEVESIDESVYQGVASLGIRPTIASSVGQNKRLLEVHLFDFDETIYGRWIQVAFLQKIRDEEYFPNISALKEQIEKDAAYAQQYFSKLKVVNEK